jgi:hypothetical protein
MPSRLDFEALSPWRGAKPRPWSGQGKRGQEIDNSPIVITAGGGEAEPAGAEAMSALS